MNLKAKLIMMSIIFAGTWSLASESTCVTHSQATTFLPAKYLCSGNADFRGIPLEDSNNYMENIINMNQFFFEKGYELKN